MCRTHSMPPLLSTLYIGTSFDLWKTKWICNQEAPMPMLKIGSRWGVLGHSARWGTHVPGQCRGPDIHNSSGARFPTSAGRVFAWTIAEISHCHNQGKWRVDYGHLWLWSLRLYCRWRRHHILPRGMTQLLDVLGVSLAQQLGSISWIASL